MSIVYSGTLVNFFLESFRIQYIIGEWQPLYPWHFYWALWELSCAGKLRTCQQKNNLVQQGCLTYEMAFQNSNTLLVVKNTFPDFTLGRLKFLFGWLVPFGPIFLRNGAEEKWPEHRRYTPVEVINWRNCVLCSLVFGRLVKIGEDWNVWDCTLIEM